MQNAYGNNAQFFGGVPPPPQVGETMYPGYNGAPILKYGNGLPVSLGG